MRRGGGRPRAPRSGGTRSFAGSKMDGEVWALTGVVGDGCRRLGGGRLALRGELERGELADGVVDVAALLQDGGHVLRVRCAERRGQRLGRMSRGRDRGFGGSARAEGA